MISKFLQILGLQPRISKFFLITRIFFSHSRSEQFWQQNTISWSVLIILANLVTTGLFPFNFSFWFYISIFAKLFIKSQYFYVPLNVEYLTTVQWGDRNHWRNGEWKADAKISCYRCNTSRKECLFSVKRSNNENFLTWIYGTFCVCVWEHISQHWFLQFWLRFHMK